MPRNYHILQANASATCVRCCCRSYTTETTFTDAVLRGIALASPAAALSMMLAAIIYKKGLDKESDDTDGTKPLSRADVQQIVLEALSMNPVSETFEAEAGIETN